MILTNAQKKQITLDYIAELTDGRLDALLEDVVTSFHNPHKVLKRTLFIFDKSRAGLLSGE